MKIRPTRSGLLLLAGYLALPGILIACLLIYLGLYWAGAALAFLWLGADTLVTVFHLSTLFVQVREGCLTAEWGIAFPRRWVLPLGGHIAVQRFTTPAMQLLNCALVTLTGPGGRLLLWAMPTEAVRALEQSLREAQP